MNTCRNCNNEFSPVNEKIKTCSIVCRDEFKLKEKLESVENKIGVDLENFLRLNYEEKQKTCRWITKETGLTARAIKKLLLKYNIKIRYGSEAIKTQWLDNNERRKRMGEVFGDYNRGMESPKGISEEEIRNKYLENNLELIDRFIENGYTYVNWLFGISSGNSLL